MLRGITEAATGLLTSRIQAFYSKYVSQKRGGGCYGLLKYVPECVYAGGGGRVVDYVYCSSEYYLLS